MITKQDIDKLKTQREYCLTTTNKQIEEITVLNTNILIEIAEELNTNILIEIAEELITLKQELLGK